MGLDMYLTGDKFKRTEYAKNSNGEVMFNEDGTISTINEEFVDGYKCTNKKLEIGYWRKHAPLHTFIVRAFADGVDDCKPIDLDAENLRWIARVLRGEDKEYELPDNKNCSGFFFGDDEWWDELRENAHEDAKIFDKASDWIEQCQEDNKYWHFVEYQASW